MTPRIAYLKPDRHIYKDTDVPLDRSIDQIKKLLQQAGCARIGTQEDLRGNIPLYTVIFEKDGVPFIIEFPIIYEKKNGKDKLNMALSGRIIIGRIKSLLIEVEIGASPFTAAMAQFTAIMDRSSGRPIQMENYLHEHKNEIPAGTLFLPGGQQ